MCLIETLYFANYIILQAYHILIIKLNISEITSCIEALNILCWIADVYRQIDQLKVFCTLSAQRQSCSMVVLNIRDHGGFLSENYPKTTLIFPLKQLPVLVKHS